MSKKTLGRWTTTLFAALSMLDGTVIGECHGRHRHQEFLKFLRQLHRVFPRRLDLHLILDNYGTHQHPTVRAWLATHPRFKLHFTPTGASWLNLVESWFSQLTQKRLRRGVFRSVPELVAAIEAYLQHYNEHPTPFVWTATADAILRRSGSVKSFLRHTTRLCESLASLALPDATVTLARVIDAGAFLPPVPTGGRPPSAAAARMFGALPAFCRVTATLTPSSDSDIKMEVWMPTADWNGKLQAVGNGAFTGSIAYRAMVAALGRGYAAGSTDPGHLGNTASFGLGHPEKAIDFGWRSVHEMTVASKEIIAAYYDDGPRYSYWNGCSAGGRQAMKEAQRFPEDFDGIIAEAAGHDWTGRAAASLRVAKPLEADTAARLSSDKAQLVLAAVLEACDAGDGVTDGVVGDPERCAFDPAVLQCSGAESDSCLTAAQVTTVRMLYSSPANPKTGRPITGLLPGSELGWTDLGWTRSARATGLDQFRFLVHADPDWTVDRFSFETDIVRAE